MSEQVRAALAAVVEGRKLSMDEARAAMGSVMDGEASPAQLAALLVALRMRGETVEELAGFTAAMRERAVPVGAPDGVIDTCGTGGDGSNTFNISTAAALVVAAAGVRSPSTATGPSPRPAARPTFWRPLASPPTSPQRRPARHCGPSASPFCSPLAITPP